MAEANPTETVRVWDPLIRIGHWVLVVAFATAYLTEGEPEWLHTWAGYAIAVTVLIRLIWGLVGPERARFSEFLAGPGRVYAYLRDLVTGKAPRHLGHSPAGAAMTIALLAALAVTAFSGMANLAAEEGEGPLAGIIAQVPKAASGEAGGVVSGQPTAGGHEYAEHEHEEHEHGEHGEGEGFWLEVHETAANVTLALILLHLCGVILSSFVHRENLARAMVTGRKRAV